MPARITAPAEPDWLVLSFGIALSLHIAVFYLLPHLQIAPVSKPERVEIDLSQSPPVEPSMQPPPPEPPKVEAPRPIARPVAARPMSQQPQQQALPILAARDDSPPAPQDAVVNNAPVPATATAVPSAPIDAAPATDAAEASAAATSTAASTSSASGEADANEAWLGYGQQLHDLVSRNKTYPQLAIRRHLQGKAKVSARFNRGRLIELKLLEPGSGHQILDTAAVEMMKKAVNALPINGDLAKKSFTVIVPVDFKIDG